MAHYSHQFLAEQLLQFRTTPVYARYNFSASRTKYTSTKEKYRTPQEYTQNNSSTSHIKYTSTKENPRATIVYIWTPLSLSATPFIPRKQGYKKTGSHRNDCQFKYTSTILCNYFNTSVNSSPLIKIDCNCLRSILLLNPNITPVIASSPSCVHSPVIIPESGIVVPSLHLTVT